MQHKPSRIVDIAFIQPKQGRESLDEINNPPKRPRISPPTFDEQKCFIKTLQAVSPHSAILSVSTLRHGPQSNTSVARSLPPTITSLGHPHYKRLAEKELYDKCDEIFQHGLKVSQQEVRYLSEATRLQSESLLWFEHRKGRITTSQFGAVCRTCIDAPSQSLIKRIMQQVPTPKVAALEWGKTYEPKARMEYVNVVETKHTSFKVEMTGLHVNPQYPHLGASPDGLISCSCCGNGLLEIKCPYSKRNLDPTQIVDSSFYLNPTESGLKLSKAHDYYHQVQGQMAICERSYCDFVCWTPLGMHIEQIERDPSHFQHMKPKLDSFFTRVILPQVLCKPDGDDKENSDPNQELFCFCRKGEYGSMIACDNPSSRYEWFHFSCVNVTAAPSGDWFCPDCR